MIIVIPDRIIEEGTLDVQEHRVAVEVRLPWYRALPGSCVAGARLTLDGVEAAPASLRWGMNGREFTFDQLVQETDEWWFPLDSALLSGDIPVRRKEGPHVVEVSLQLYIPYIVTDHGVLRIEEHDTKTMDVSA